MVCIHVRPGWPALHRLSLTVETPEKSISTARGAEA